MTENVNDVLFDVFANQYTALVQTIFKLPMNDDMKRIVRENFDTGFLWVKEAAQIHKMNSSVDNINVSDDHIDENVDGA